MASSPEHDWIEQALLYASLHEWALIPLMPRLQVTPEQTGMSPPEPRFQNWKEEYASDEPSIRSWGDVVEPSDIGLVTGWPSSVITLEVRINGGGPETLDRFLENKSECRDTVCFSDYNRDRWLLYRHPGFPVFSGELGPGLYLHGEESIIRLPESQYLRASGGLSWDVAPGLHAPSVLPGSFWQAVGLDVHAVDGDQDDASHPQPLSLPFVRGADVAPSDSGPEWIAPPWAAASSLTLLLGMAKQAGKSTWLRHLARSVLTGETFLSEPTVAAPVVFLTEESRAVFDHGLAELGLTAHAAAGDLHILYQADVAELPWADVVEACADQCRATGARMVIIDTINRFAGVQTVERLSVEAVHVLERLLLNDVAVVAGVHHPRITNSLAEDVLPSLSMLGSSSDTVCHLRCLPAGKATHRRIDVWSRFQNTQGRYIQLIRGKYELLRTREGWDYLDGQFRASEQQLTLTGSPSTT